MGNVRCGGCDLIFTVDVTCIGLFNHRARTILAGTLKCSCGHQTPLNAEAAFPFGSSIVNTREVASDLPAEAPAEVKGAYSEARTCIYGGAYRAAVAFCRTTGEEMLRANGYKGDFNNQIKSAKCDGFIDDQLEMLATGARLIGRNALHRGQTVTMGQALNALGAIADFVSAVLSNPIPASQSSTGSIGQSSP